MKCYDIMKQDVQCLDKDETVQEAARRMRDYDLGFLPICDKEGRALGTLTDRDIAIRICAENRPAESSVTAAMTREVVSCRPDDDLHLAEDLMSRHRKSRIMVTDDDGVLVGIISLSDIAQHEELRRTGYTIREVSSREAHIGR